MVEAQEGEQPTQAGAAAGSVEHIADEARNDVDNVAEAAHETVSAASDWARNAASEAGGTVADAIDATRENAAAGVRQATDFVAGVGDEAVAHVKRHPTRTVLLVAAGAAIVGFVVGAMSTKHR